MEFEREGSSLEPRKHYSVEDIEKFFDSSAIHLTDITMAMKSSKNDSENTTSSSHSAVLADGTLNIAFVLEQANTLLLHGESRLARKIFRKILDQEQRADAFEGLGLSYELEQQYHYALECFLEANRIEPNYSRLMKLAGFYIRRGEDHKARVVFEDLIKLPKLSYDQKIESVKLLINTMIRLEEFEDAKTLFEALPPECQSSDDLLVTRGQIAIYSKHYAQASELFQRATELDPTDAKAWSGRGTLLMLDGSFEEAFSAFSKSLRFDLSQTQSLVNLIDIGFRLSKYVEIEELITDYLSAFKPHRGVLLSFAAVLYRQNRLEESLQKIEECLKLSPSFEPAKELRERILRKRVNGDIEKKPSGGKTSTT